MRLTISTALFLTTLFFNFSCSKDANLAEEDQEINQEVNLSLRAEAKKLYEDYYLESSTDSSDIAWSGDEASCNSGEVPEDTMDKIFTRLSYFRKAAGLNNSIAENNTKSEKAQDAALMMKSNGSLDHFPPSSWSCYTESGSEAAGKSLLTQTRNAEAIDSYIRDAGAANGPVGHRRWLLWPRLQEIGIGNTDNTNAIWVIGNAGTPPTDAPDFIAWPPEGYTPKQVAYQRWSFSIAGADFTSTSISMKDENNETIALEIEELNNQFGDRTIVWVPSINTNALNEDTLYTITLNDVGIDDQMETFEYDVILFDVTD